MQRLGMGANGASPQDAMGCMRWQMAKYWGTCCGCTSCSLWRPFHVLNDRHGNGPFPCPAFGGKGGWAGRGVPIARAEPPKHDTSGCHDEGLDCLQPSQAPWRLHLHPTRRHGDMLATPSFPPPGLGLVGAHGRADGTCKSARVSAHVGTCLAEQWLPCGTQRTKLSCRCKQSVAVLRAACIYVQAALLN